MIDQSSTRSDWTEFRLGSLLASRTRRGGQHLPLLSVVREKGVIPRDVSSKEANHNFIPDDLSNYKVVEPGQLVINKMKAWSGSLGIAWQEGIVSPAYFVYDVAIENKRFSHYLLRSRTVVDEFARCSGGVRVGQWDLNIPAMKSIRIRKPTEDEQELIVRYLDHAELRIAKAIAAKHAVLARLTELRRARVAQGILGSSGTKLIVGGLPFLVPDDWDLAPFWFVAPSVSQRGNGSLELLSVYLDRGVIRYSDSSGQVHKPSEDLSAYQLVHPGDLVLNNQQAWRGSLGVSKFTGIVSPAYIVCRLSDRFDSVFSNFLFRSQPMVSQFEIASRGVGSIQRQVHKQSLRTVRVPIPPKEEQVRIAGELVEATKAIDDATASLRSEIALLAEYRTRLISDVVTGKFDVREEAAKLPVIDPDELVEVTAGAGLTAEDDGDDE